MLKILKSLQDISKWNMENVKDIRYIFESCLSLESLPDISKWKLNIEVEKGFMFQGLNEKIIPSGFENI